MLYPSRGEARETERDVCFLGEKKKKYQRGAERNTSGILASLWINVHSVKKIKLNKYH